LILLHKGCRGPVLPSCPAQWLAPYTTLQGLLFYCITFILIQRACIVLKWKNRCVGPSSLLTLNGSFFRYSLVLWSVFGFLWGFVGFGVDGSRVWQKPEAWNPKTP
jgi:hypothetical protein